MMKINSRKFFGIFALFFSFIFFAQVSAVQASTLTGENVITLINQSRAEEGLNSLAANTKLTQAATAKANDMISKQYFEHVGPDGRGPEDWIEDAGYDWIAIGENIAYGYTTAESVHTAFMNSPGHRANIMGADYEHVGVAAVSGQYQGQTVIMVVEEFGATNAVEPTTYALTVNNGTGDGTYAQGQTITIHANTAASGQVFDKWIGDTSYVASVTSSTTTVTIPNKTIVVTATYKDASPTTYALSVNSGVGSGLYVAGTSVTITANTPAAGKVFDRWTGDTSYVSSLTSTIVTVTMPAKAISLTATYKDVPTYLLTINSGSGDGTYTEGKKITITADAPAAGKIFDKWTGSTAYVASITSATTTVTMPGVAISLTATYKNTTAATYLLSINGGDGSASYISGTKVTITANAPASGQVFDKWTGDTSYLSSIYVSTCTVTMPAKAITLTATYKAVTTTTYILTITNGIGDGSYISGTNIDIIANAPATGKLFDKWTGDISYISDVNSIATIVTMPAKAITLTATYKDISAPVTTYKLTVTYGSGSGSYAAGTGVTIAANAPAAGKIFDKWTGSTTYVSDVTSSTTTVTMPNVAITLTATYKAIPIVKYTLTITGGTGSGSYALGTDVSIRANAPATGQIFDQWTGDINYVFDPKLATTKVTIPERDINLTATFKNKTAAYADGTLIKTLDSPKVYVIISGKKKWIPTPEVFEQLKYKWTTIKVISEIDLDAYPDYEDNLIRAIGDSKVYLVVSGVKRHIPNPNIFLDYGFEWNDVKDVEQAVVDKYKNTYLIRASKTTSIYYLTNGIRKLIPTADIFNSYNDNWADVQVISQNEMNAYPLSNLIKLKGSADVYLVEGNVKRRITSAAVFNKYQFNWNYVVAVNQEEFNYYKTGAELK